MLRSDIHPDSFSSLPLLSLRGRSHQLALTPLFYRSMLDFFSQTLITHAALVPPACFTASVFSVVGSPPCGSTMKQLLLLSGNLWNSSRPPTCSTLIRH